MVNNKLFDMICFLKLVFKGPKLVFFLPQMEKNCCKEKTTQDGKED
jgi:hypothetical protein